MFLRSIVMSAAAVLTLASSDCPSAALSILFVGNSFTYGPPPYDREDQTSLNNLPRFFKLVASSLQPDLEVQIAEDTIGGCTLWTHRPSVNPEACSDPEQCQTVDNYRVPATRDCTVPADTDVTDDSYHPCPQTLTRQPYGVWDWVVLQDYSALPTVQQARESMMYPAFSEYVKVLSHQGGATQDWTKPKVASYMTWSYYNGSMTSCPGGSTAGCFPFGTLDEMTNNCSDAYWSKVREQQCQAYSLARGYASTLDRGADVLVPAGLAWQAARGAPSIPEDCKAAIDAEYDTAGALGTLDLPLSAADPANVRWAGWDAAQKLYRDKGPTYTSPYCANNCTIDHHASALGEYLNALVFYATLFKKSPIGAAAPSGQVIDGMTLPTIEDPADVEALQHIAHDIVMPHLDVWWGN